MALHFWILVFLSPFLLYAQYLILDESRDPLLGFHEEFRATYFGLPEVEIDRNRIRTGFLRGVKVRDLSVAIVSSASILLVSLGLPLSLILALAGGCYAFYLWKGKESERDSVKTASMQEAEFPAVVELLAILIAAGESPSSALVRVADRSHGRLSESLCRIAEELRNGQGLLSSLETASAQSRSNNFKRFCDSLIVAVQRGSPLVEVLQSQVTESRTSANHALIKSGGRAEIALMIPIVFLILPVSILFALWPSFVTLGASISG
jgi:tight adherence protein C